MANKLEGQIDFLGLISEYTDDQGATVRVKSPGSRKTRVKADEPAQLKLEFIDLDAEFEAEQSGTVETEPVTMGFEPMCNVSDKNNETNAKNVEFADEQIEPVQTKSDEPVKLPESAVVEETTEMETPAPFAESKPKRSKKAASKELLFKQCLRCWCYDCKHNSRNEGIPREMCGAMIPCPACNGCVIEEMATVCEIGNAEEGCKFRAIEEGIFVPETLDD